MGVLILLGAIAAIACAALVYFGRRDLALRKEIVDTPTTWARDVHQGFVEVKGSVMPGEVVTSPFQQVQAVLVRWTVEEYRKRGKSSSWVKVLSGMEVRDFFVRDDSGSVRVSIQGASPTLYLAGKNTSSSGVFRAPPEHVEAFLSQHGRSTRGWVLNKSMRFTEECIQPGEHLYVMGHATRQGSEARLDSGAGRMILANLTEDELMRRVGNAATWKLAIGGILGLGAVAMVVAGVMGTL